MIILPITRDIKECYTYTLCHMHNKLCADCGLYESKVSLFDLDKVLRDADMFYRCDFINSEYTIELYETNNLGHRTVSVGSTIKSALLKAIRRYNEMYSNTNIDTKAKIKGKIENIDDVLLQWRIKYDDLKPPEGNRLILEKKEQEEKKEMKGDENVCINCKYFVRRNDTQNFPDSCGFTYKPTALFCNVYSCSCDRFRTKEDPYL